MSYLLQLKLDIINYKYYNLKVFGNVIFICVLSVLSSQISKVKRTFLKNDIIFFGFLFDFTFLNIFSFLESFSKFFLSINEVD